MKYTFTMMRSILTIVFAIGVSATMVSAQSENQFTPGINGVWTTQVTPRICATGAPLGQFPGILLFAQDGTMTGTSSALASTYGLWQRGKGFGAYSFATIALRYDAGGGVIGSRRIAQDITVDQTGLGFTSAGTFQDFDVAGNLIMSGCATSTGTRFQ